MACYMTEKQISAYDNYHDIAYRYLEKMGAEGKMMLFALLKDEDAFHDAYREWQENEISRYF